MAQGETLSLKERARRIKAIVLDVDGVLTDGRLFFSADGEVLKAFHVLDGMGLALSREAGLETAIITGRSSQIVQRRSDELKIGHLYQGVSDKVTALTNLLEEAKLSIEEICYVGDDINDLPLLLSVGLACTVPNGAAEAKEAAHFITQRQGGEGAVREIIEMILKAQSKWDSLINRYKQPGCNGLCQ
ncbi:MAG: HAD hydrolase family protein [Sporomusaceae bacterium]|nr:HAD hydrolase family protein [Sporomusaceae bacterium]